MPCEDIRYLLWHASVEMTVRYLGITEGDVRAAMVKFRHGCLATVYPRGGARSLADVNDT
jgi:hypothetical protein